MHPDKWADNYMRSVNAALDGEFALIQVGGTELECEIASVHESRVRGLSERAQLPRDGMIFMYEGDHNAAFQSRGMSLDVSIWFFDAQGNLVANGWTDGVATSPEAYRYVIETRPEIELEGSLRIMSLVD